MEVYAAILRDACLDHQAFTAIINVSDIEGQASALEEEGSGCPVVKVSDHSRHLMSSIPVPLKTRRVGQRCTLNLSRVETPAPVGVVW
ncbi:hypothetical protein TNCV_4225061 [Trichonephila clavipes]|uniref:Uncharacterized protein n=1 Tax=Trichonephila clavipes TaxID=2585209 RepID=A0A8X6SSF3_TRICX|nr:hypothetical protein TNCV_4225061 [Trichonephila clavipes]